jgi:DNA-binding MarR family transcriptional regulator
MNTAAESANDPIDRIEELAQDLMRRLDLLGGSKVHEDISYGQYKVISVIHHQGPISVGNLGRLVGSAQSTTSEMVARLTKAGLVNKVRGPYDGRVVMVELTDQGRQLMRRRRKRVREGYHAMFEKLGPLDRDGFVTSIKSLLDVLVKVTD